MPNDLPAVSTDQVAAFVELAHRGSLRAAARESHVTEQGLRNRLLALEQRLGVELYHKGRGRRLRSQPSISSCMC
jgi:DNA-binding transcriptional LysR family regulator